MRSESFGLASLVFGLAASVTSTAFSADPPEVHSNAKVAIDLSKLELAKPIGTNVRNLAELSYTADSTVAQAYAHHEKQLRAAGAVPKEGAAVTDQYASAVFQGKGDRFAVMIFPAGGKGVMVTISNQGPIELGQLPVPEGAKRLFEGPSSVQYVSEQPVEAVREAVRAKLGEAGFSPYGDAGPIATFKNGPILIKAMIQAAPGQGGKTVVDYQSQRLSADIDAPAEATRIAYAESTKSLDSDTKLGIDDVVERYGRTLAAKGWKPTTEKPVKEKFDYFWIFRNGDGELLDLKLRKIGEGTRILTKFMTAAEVEEENRKAKATAEKAKKGTMAAKTLTIPQPASGIERWKVTPRTISAVARSGQARTVALSIRDSLKKEGWKVTAEVTEPIAGSINLTKAEMSVSITYDDTGVTPAGVSITVTGADFATAAGGKK